MILNVLIYLFACYLIPIVLIVGKHLAVNSARRKLQTKVMMGEFSADLVESELSHTKMQFNGVIWLAFIIGTIAAVRFAIANS